MDRFRPRLAGLAFLGLLSLVAPVDRADAQVPVETQKLTAPDGAGSDFYGGAVALHGDIAAVSALQNDAGATNSGAVYVYTRSGAGPWVFEAKLLPSDPTGNKLFGTAVAVFGDRVLVGASQDSNAVGFTGAAYLFRRQAPGAWVQEAKWIPSDGASSDFFGSSVALGSDVAVVGSAADDDPGSDSGSAYVFRKDAAGVWAFRQKLRPLAGAAGDRFAGSVALDAGRLLVGASQLSGTGAGYACVFAAQPDGSFTQEARLAASDGLGGDRFGHEVALAGDVALMSAVGSDAAGTDSGSAYVFRRGAGGAWVQEKKLVPVDGYAQLRFGDEVALEAGAALVGANEVFGSARGRAYLFRDDGSGAWAQQDLLLASDGIDGDEFGTAVAISADSLLVGASHAAVIAPRTGAAYAYELPRDADGDGIPDESDACPRDPLNDADGDALCGDERLLGSLNAATTLSGVAIGKEDVFVFEEATNQYGIYFDGSDVGLGTKSVDAVHLLPDGSLLLSLGDSRTLPGVGTVQDHDVVRFVPTLLGENTQGVFELYFSGADHGIGGTQDVDSVGVDENGLLHLSISGSATLNGVSVAKEDIVTFDPATGLYAMYFDGSDVGLAAANVDTLDLQPDGTILIGFAAAESLPGLGSVGKADVVRFVPTALGPTTSGTFERFFSAQQNGIPASIGLDAFHRVVAP